MAATIRRRPDLFVWLLICGLAMVLLDRLAAPGTFWFDEWAFILTRRTNGIDTFLAPHNGHLSVLPVIAFKILMATVGLSHYHPYRLMGLLTHILVASALFRYVRMRMGSAPAMCAGVVVLLLGAGWQDLLWPFQIGFMGTVFAGITVWNLLEGRTHRRDGWASVALAAALACSGLGIGVLAGTALRLVVERDVKRLVRVLLAPTVLYAVWYLVYGDSEGSISNVPRLPWFVSNEAAASAGALGGLDIGWSRVVLVAVIALAITTAARGHRPTAAILAPLGCALTNWALIGYSRAQYGDYASSRYVYVGGILTLLILADVLAPINGWVVYFSSLVLSVLCVWGNWQPLNTGADYLRYPTNITRSELRAVEWAAETVDASYRPDPYRMPQVVSGPYLAAVADLGSPAATDGEVVVNSYVARSEADRVSIEALKVAFYPAGSIAGITRRTVVGEDLKMTVAAGDCVLVTGHGRTERKLETPLLSGEQLYIGSTTQPTEVRLRRYADTVPNDPTAVIKKGLTSTVLIPGDSAPLQTWVTEVRSAGDIRVCNFG